MSSTRREPKPPPDQSAHQLDATGRLLHLLGDPTRLRLLPLHDRVGDLPVYELVARSGTQHSAVLDKIGYVAATEKLRQLQALGKRVYACGPPLACFKVDPSRLALEKVTVCEYLTFMEVMQQRDEQLYA